MVRMVKTGREGQRHQRVNSDGAHMSGRVFQHSSYSGRIPSLTSINHKRGKSGQNEVNSTHADLLTNQNADMALQEDEDEFSAAAAADQTAFVDEE